MPALIAYVDARFRYRWVNQGYERWFGLPAREVEGRHVRDVLGRQAWEIARPYLERARAGEVVAYEEWMPYRLGQSRGVCVTCVPDRDERGHVRGFVAHVTDVTGRQQAEEALRRAHESLQRQSEELAVAYDELRARSEELAGANEELQAQAEEVQVQSAQLQETGRRLRLALEAGGMGHWEWDLQKDALSWCEWSRALLDLNPSAPGTVESFLRRERWRSRPTSRWISACCVSARTPAGRSGG